MRCLDEALLNIRAVISRERILSVGKVKMPFLGSYTVTDCDSGWNCSITRCCGLMK